MAIPENITAKHVLKAISNVDKEGVPSHRKSYKYYVSYKGQLYPPKYLISLANFFINGEMLNPNPKVFNTYKAQWYLKYLGFHIIIKKSKPKKNAQA